ncbi:hypothetical protein FJTKL_06133 [Diaporthe vaccinii]|uniref:Uncharacterized protein n=1 Tax=Diaporthe vaccinii TaxID=105482 RepID=A0ABR4EXF1_9PEZI
MSFYHRFSDFGLMSRTYNHGLCSLIIEDFVKLGPECHLRHSLLSSTPLVDLRGLTRNTVLLFPEPLGQRLVQEDSIAIVPNIVIRVAKDHRVELLRADSLAHQVVGQHSSILEVHIVVADAVGDLEATSNVLEALRLPHRRGVVPSRIQLRRLHVTLRVHGVVEAPVRDRRRDQPKREDAAVELDDLGRQVPAVRPAPVGDVVRVGRGQPLGDLLRRPDLVLRLEVA